LGRRKRITRKGLKHDALVETAAKGTRFVEEHLSKVVVGVVVVIVAVVAFTFIQRGRRAAEAEAGAQLASATSSLNQGLTLQATQQFEEIIASHPGSQSAGAATCYLGVVHFHEGDYGRALERFDEYLARHRGQSVTLTKTAIEGRASIHEQQRDFAAAAEAYVELADFAADQDEQTAAAKSLADAMRCRHSAGDWSGVATVAQRIVDEHPDTRWGEAARVRLAEARIYTQAP